MFDQYIIVAGTLRNTGPAGAETGFSFGVRLPYYRGLGLSMVEDLAVEVDGEAVQSERISLHLHGRTYRLGELPGVLDDRWEMGEVADLLVDRAGGLPAGPHEVFVRERLRISYMPVPGGGEDRKELTLQR
ncbi:hypothetical protein AUQ48_04855 [Kocuria flava]|uniref:C-deglycosylation enzyme beta subunit n=1 Tax=Kocuria flava TaxID=446860 RepID=A0A2N4T0F0_9MICC|nr:DUF6379 domain-containing protein [Kocuria flava]PLC11690.1 hypothetical protein AUQ48_04855 [Kocuria flava]